MVHLLKRCFDLIQSELPPPPGYFLTLAPSDVNGRTLLSLRVLPLPEPRPLTFVVGPLIPPPEGRDPAAPVTDAEVDAVATARFLDQSAAPGTEDARGMGLVHHEARPADAAQERFVFEQDFVGGQQGVEF